MKVIIAGSREIKDENKIRKCILEGIKECGEPTEILHGNAPGVDQIAAKICEDLGYKVTPYPANWKNIKGKPPEEVKENKFGKYWVKAGYERNEQMAKDGDVLIAIHNQTGGTADMINRAKSNGVKVFEFDLSDKTNKLFNFWD